MSLLKRIERYMRATRMSPTRFGRLALRDPRFVRDLRRGRRPTRRTEARILAFLAAHAPGDER